MPSEAMIQVLQSEYHAQPLPCCCAFTHPAKLLSNREQLNGLFNCGNKVGAIKYPTNTKIKKKKNKSKPSCKKKFFIP